MAVKIIKKVGTFGQHLGGGFVRTVTGAAWQYMLLPDQPCVKDASTWEQREQAARPMFGILQALADMTPHLTTAGRKANEGFYRQVHILAINASLKYQPSPTLDETNRIRLAREFGDLVEHDRFTLFGVRLNTGGQKEDWKTKTLDIIERLTSASDWEKDEAFDADRNRILDILTSNGCTYPSDMQMQRAFSWWPTTRKPETMPVLIEHQHMHTFPNYKSSYLGQHLEETLLDCDTWTNRIQGSYPLTILTLGAIPWQGNDERTTPNTDWAARMLASVPSGGAGAVALSVRGLVEPGELSREQIDKDKQKVVDKVIEQANSGYKQNLEVAQDLNLASDVYGRDGHPYPTLVKTHTHVAIPQIVEHVDALGYPGVVEANFDRQYQAWEDMQIGSEGTLEYNPSPCFWPAPILAYAGLNGRAFTGDDTGRGLETDLPGALIGMTESDRQPAYDSPFRASIQHRQPFSLCVGSTGSGKTRLGLHLASQWGRLPDPETGNLIPVVFSDPKPNSDDFTPFVKSHGGRIVRLDSKNAIGLLDPLRCIPDSMWDMQLQTSVEMLSQITGANRSEEMALTSIVAYGHSHGADCLGECVDLAWKAYHGRLPDGDRVAPLVDDLKPVLDRLVVSDPLMPLIYATRHGGVKLSVSSGMTLISAGTLNIITEKEVESAPTAVQRWVCRMVAMGASCLICGRNGMFVCDEAWSLLLDDFGRSVVNRMGRLGRAQHYMALFLSQKADEFVDAGIQEYTSRVYCMALGARNEGEGRDSQAQAACRLMNQPLDGRMHERMMHDRVIDPDSRQPDYESLYALTDPNDGHLLRGSIAYVASGDAGPAIPVEIRVADSLA